MFAFDVKTIFYLFFFGAILTLVTFFLYAFIARLKRTTFYFYVVAKSFLAVTFFLFANRETLNSLFYVGLANSFMLFGLSYEIYALIYAYKGFNRNQFFLFNAIALTLSSIFLLTFSSFDRNMWVSLMSFLSGSLFIYGGVRLLTGARHNRIQKLAGLIFCLLFISMMVRGSHSLLSGKMVSLLSSDLIQVFVYLSFFLMTYLLPILYLLILKERDLENLKELLSQNEILMKELQHRVKNNLQVISGLLFMEMDKLTESQAVSVFKNSISRIQSMSLIYERLYLSKDLAKVDLKKYISSLTDAIYKTYALNLEQISLETRLEEVLLDSARAVPMGLIINEVICNSIKHAFPGGRKGKIRVDLSLSEGRLVLCVSDDGVGLPENFDFLKLESMGMKLTQMLAKQIEAQLDIQNNQGVKVCLFFQI